MAMKETLGKLTVRFTAASDKPVQVFEGVPASAESRLCGFADYPQSRPRDGIFDFKTDKGMVRLRLDKIQECQFIPYTLIEAAMRRLSRARAINLGRMCCSHEPYMRL